MVGLDRKLPEFAAVEPQIRAAGPPWLDRIRADALDRFAGLGFPTTHDEEWKYTNVAPITRLALDPALRVPAAVELSAPGSLPKGVRLCSLAEAFRAEPDLLEEHLARHAGFERHAFVALNTAFLEDGVLLHIPDGVVVEQPLQLLFAAAANGRPTVSHPRVLVVAGRDSQATVIESYRGADGSVYFTNAVTEVVLGEGALLDYTRLVTESDRAFHFGALHVRQGRSSSFTSHSVTLGGGLVRNEVGAVLAGEGAECALNGLYAARGRQHIDNYTTIDHARPHSTSHELYKGILDGHAQAVFHGRIIVRREAQKTDAIQRNKNLLLSEDAVVNTKPQLEIYADDVRCTHGATVGQVDADALFYLRSRGIAQAQARHLLTCAFAGEMIDRLKVEALRGLLAETLAGRLEAERGGGG